MYLLFFFFSSRRRHTSSLRDWSSDVCSSDLARDQARQILGGRRYKPADVPRPFEGALEWLGDRLRPIGDFFSRITESLAGRVALAAVLAGVVAVIALLVARHRAATNAAGGAGRGRRSAEEQADPGRLEREADA